MEISRCSHNEKTFQEIQVCALIRKVNNKGGVVKEIPRDSDPVEDFAKGGIVGNLESRFFSRSRPRNASHLPLTHINNLIRLQRLRCLASQAGQHQRYCCLIASVVELPLTYSSLPQASGRLIRKGTCETPSTSPSELYAYSPRDVDPLPLPFPSLRATDKTARDTAASYTCAAMQFGSDRVLQVPSFESGRRGSHRVTATVLNPG